MLRSHQVEKYDERYDKMCDNRGPFLLIVFKTKLILRMQIELL